MSRCFHPSLNHGIVHLLLLAVEVVGWPKGRHCSPTENSLCQFGVFACGVARMGLLSFCLCNAFTCFNIDRANLIHQRHQTFSSQALRSNVRQTANSWRLNQFCLPSRDHILDPIFPPLPVAKLSGTWGVGEVDLVHPHLQDEDEVKTPLDVDCITHCRNNAVESRFTWTQRDDSLRSCWAKKITTTQHVQTAWCRFPVLFVEGPICIAVRFQRPEFCEGNFPLALWRRWAFQKKSKLTCCFQMPHQFLQVLKSSKCWLFQPPPPNLLEWLLLLSQGLLPLNCFALHLFHNQKFSSCKL